MSNRPKVKKPKMKAPTVINIVEVKKAYKENISLLKKLKSKYEAYIKKFENNKKTEIQINVLEVKRKLFNIDAEIKAKEQYISFFEEHDVRNRKN